MLRIHFTVADLLNVTFARAPAPLLEQGLAMSTLQQGRGDPVFDSWRRRMVHTLPAAAHPLLRLYPATATGPLFLDPVIPGVEESIEHVLSTPRSVVAEQLRKLPGPGSAPARWMRNLAAGEREAWHTLESGLRAANSHIFGGTWERLAAGFNAERAWRLQQLADRGVYETLRGLAPHARWNGTTLETDDPRDREIHSEGHGITLVPSLFWRGRPMPVLRPGGPTWLVYPAVTPLPLIERRGRGDRVTALLGPTRAEVLNLLTTPYTTTDIAYKLGIGKSSASEHTKVLREAGLVASRRDGKAVRHTCTTLGLALLSGVRETA